MPRRRWVRILIFLVSLACLFISAARLYSMRDGIQWMWWPPNLHFYPYSFMLSKTYIPQFEDPVLIPQRLEKENAVPIFKFHAPVGLLGYLSDSKFYCHLSEALRGDTFVSVLVYADTAERTLETITPPTMRVGRAAYLPTERAVVYTAGGKGKLYLQQDKTKPKILRRFGTGEGAGPIAASPHGAEIAYILRSSHPRSKNKGCTLVWMNVHTGETRDLLRLGSKPDENIEACWGPGTNEVTIFLRTMIWGAQAETYHTGSTSPQLMVVRTDGSASPYEMFPEIIPLFLKVEMPHAMPYPSIANLSWSPDGAYFAFICYNIKYLGNSQIYVVRKGEKEFRQLTRLGGRGIVWGPKGDSIAFTGTDKISSYTNEIYQTYEIKFSPEVFDALPTVTTAEADLAATNT